MIRVVFLGTPEFAVPSLEALIKDEDFEVVGVITQPDRPAGRGQQLRQSPVKQVALKHGIPVYQPKKLRNNPEALEKLREWLPDVMVVAAFGQILPREVLEAAPHGCINVHASLLPRWRGAAPIQYAIRAGDTETGVSIMKLDEGLDTGPTLVRWATPIRPDDTAATLHDRLAAYGARALTHTLRAYVEGLLKPEPQPEEGVTYAPALKKEQGRIDWAEPAEAVDRHVRAYDPWPGTFTTLDGEMLKIIGGKPLPGENTGRPPGTVVEHDGGLAVQTGDGLYVLESVQPAGKRAMSAQAYLAGHADVIGQRLGEDEE